MKTAFVRGVWGDDQIPRHDKVFRDIETAQRKHLPLEHMTMVFGRENFARIRHCGIVENDYILSPDSLVDWNNTGDRGSNIHCPYGVSIWRHKLAAIRAALEHADAVIWLDWDCRRTRELPADFWLRMNSGPEIQAPLTKYRRNKCPWRDPKNDAQKYVPCGSFVYVRGIRTADWLLRLAEDDELHYDEQIYARAIDHKINGWKGTDNYRLFGYEPREVTVHRGVFRDDAKQLFYAPLRQRKDDLP